MPAFCVMIEGRNFLVDTGGVLKKLGFYVGCFVEAADRESAGLAAVEQVRRRASLRGLVRNRREDPPGLFIAEVSEVPTVEGEAERGLAWFPDEAEATKES